MVVAVAASSAASKTNDENKNFILMHWMILAQILVFKLIDLEIVELLVLAMVVAVKIPFYLIGVFSFFLPLFTVKRQREEGDRDGYLVVHIKFRGGAKTRENLEVRQSRLDLEPSWDHNHFSLSQ